jgi:hypothetical protein
VCVLGGGGEGRLAESNEGEMGRSYLQAVEINGRLAAVLFVAKLDLRSLLVPDALVDLPLLGADNTVSTLSDTCSACSRTMPLLRWKSISRVKRPALASAMAFWMVACGTWYGGIRASVRPVRVGGEDQETNNLLDRGLVVNVQLGVLVDTTVGLLGLVKRLIHNKLHKQMRLWQERENQHGSQIYSLGVEFVLIHQPSSSRPG